MKKSAGFSLVEVLVTTFIITVLVAAMYRVLHVGTMTYHTDMGVLDLHQNSRQAMHLMLKELRESSLGDVTITDESDDSDEIVFNTPNETGIHFVLDEDDDNGDGVLNQILREYPNGTYSILANNITLLQFSINNQLLEIVVRANNRTLGRDLFVISRGRVRLRNE